MHLGVFIKVIDEGVAYRGALLSFSEPGNWQLNKVVSDIQLILICVVLNNPRRCHSKRIFAICMRNLQNKRHITSSVVCPGFLKFEF